MRIQQKCKNKIKNRKKFINGEKKFWHSTFASKLSWGYYYQIKKTYKYEIGINISYVQASKPIV
jgi:hypothetical protein